MKLFAPVKKSRLRLTQGFTNCIHPLTTNKEDLSHAFKPKIAISGMQFVPHNQRMEAECKIKVYDFDRPRVQT